MTLDTRFPPLIVRGHLCRLQGFKSLRTAWSRKPHRRVLVEEVLHGVLVHLQRVHKVLRVASYPQGAALAEVTRSRQEIT